MCRRRWLIALCAAISLLLLAACGDGESSLKLRPRVTGTTDAPWSLLCVATNPPATVMPDVVGQGLRVAAQRLCDLRLALGDVKGGPDDVVYEQYPAAGEPVDGGTRVNL